MTPFVLQVVESKVQTIWIEKKKKNKKTGDESSFSVPTRIGIYIKLNDGHEHQLPAKTVYDTAPDKRCNGGLRLVERIIPARTVVGTGTVWRYNFKHKTWSRQAPDQLAGWRSGTPQLTPKGEPVWVESRRESGTTPAELVANYGADFLAMLAAACEQALAAEAAKKAA
jgi:hypothetical protein